MERNYDEVISDVLIQLVSIEQARLLHEERLKASNRRMDLTIKRVVKIEQRLEDLEKQIKRVQKVNRIFMANQTNLNQAFSNFIRKNPSK